MISTLSWKGVSSRRVIVTQSQVHPTYYSMVFFIWVSTSISISVELNLMKKKNNTLKKLLPDSVTIFIPRRLWFIKLFVLIRLPLEKYPLFIYCISSKPVGLSYWLPNMWSWSEFIETIFWLIGLLSCVIPSAKKFLIVIKFLRP